MKTSAIIVENGGQLIIDGGSITQGNIIVKNGGVCSITEGGEIRLDDSSKFKVELGGLFNQTFGRICIIN